jgi:uncharacterized protein HemX
MNNANAFEETSHIHDPLLEPQLDEPQTDAQGERQYEYADESVTGTSPRANHLSEEPMAESHGFESMQDQVPAKSNKIKMIIICTIAVAALGAGGYYFYNVQTKAAAAKVVQEQEAKATAAAALQKAKLAEAAEKEASEAKKQAAKKAEEAAAEAKIEAERAAAENAKRVKAKAAAKADPKVVYPTLSAPAVERSYQPKPSSPKQAWFTVNPS